MAKKKRTPSSTGDAEFSSGNAPSDDVPDDDDGEMLDSDLALDVDFEEDLTDPKTGSVAARRLAVKRRLDAHLERKWFREHGWDDEDDLFNDEFFGEPDQKKAGSR